MREIFKGCGEIFSIRWPSLKYNTHRRFCYISFRTPDAAAAATRLDGQLLENCYKLEAKYSDPGRKKPREGAMTEGRELHVANLDRSATEDEMRDVFSKYGNVESVRILKNLAGKSKGGGFVVFGKKEDATEALALNKTKFKAQILTVELSTATNFKPTATSTAAKGSSASPAPTPDGEGGVVMSPSPAPDTQTTNTHALHSPSRAEISSRTITLMGIPDTVNDARIRAIVEPYGTIVKLVLRPDHQGAIIEFADVSTAGLASLGLENHEIVPGRRLRIGGLKDLFQEKDEIKTDRIQVGQGKKTTPHFTQPSAPIRRPGAGGRGGLGTKRGLDHSGTKPAAAKPDLSTGNLIRNGDGNTGSAPKSNADFKAMFLSGGKT
jgi:RNA recognition motif-containing protein